MQSADLNKLKVYSKNRLITLKKAKRDQGYGYWTSAIVPWINLLVLGGTYIQKSKNSMI